MTTCDYCTHVEMCGWRKEVKEQGCEFFGDGIGWIPVSERLPEKDGRYLVTYPLLGDDLWVSTAWYGTPPMPNRPVKGKCFFVSDDEWGDVPYDDVVAWMPLPEPYREDGEA